LSLSFFVYFLFVGLGLFRGVRISVEFILVLLIGSSSSSGVSASGLKMSVISDCPQDRLPLPEEVLLVREDWKFRGRGAQSLILRCLGCASINSVCCLLRAPTVVNEGSSRFCTIL
jgi:hypothetical protein